jgi:hypothetical protein
VSSPQTVSKTNRHCLQVCELLRDNLYELYKYISKSDWTPYFTLPRVRSIAHQRHCFVAKSAAGLLGLVLPALPIPWLRAKGAH